MSSTDTELLREKDDGYRYSRPTRRIARLLDLARQKYIKASELVDRAATHPEFHRMYLGTWDSIKPDRVRDYVTFARMAGYLVGEGESVRSFDQVPPRGKIDDERWTAIISQQALEFLQGPLNVEGGAFRARDRIHELLEELEAARKHPTIAALAEAAEISGTRDEEVFRWALLAHMDGSNSRFTLLYRPRVVWKG